MFLFGKKDDSAKVLAKINKKAIKYCAARDENGNEVVLGKKGAINVFDDEITIVCDGTLVFRCHRKNAKAFELMSLGGVTVTGVDDDGNKVCVTAYYTSP